MTYIKQLFIITLLLSVVSCANTYQGEVGFDTNSKVDTKHYKTFTWLSLDKITSPSADFNPIMKQRIEEEIELAFVTKGYQLVTEAEKADFTISYTLNNRVKVIVNSMPVLVHRELSRRRGYFYGMFNSHVATDVHVRQYTQGKFAITIYDVKSGQPAWYGWAIKRLTAEDKKNRSQVIKNMVNDALAQFQR